MTANPWALLVRNQMLGFVREPAAAVFNLALPLFIVLVQALAYGDSLVGKELPGLRVADVLPIGAGVTYLAIVGIFGAGVGLASMVEARTLASFRLRPGGVGSVVSAYVVVLIALSLTGFALGILTLILGWNARGAEHWWALVPAALLGAVTCCALGGFIASLSASPRSAQAIASALFFPTLFLSGALIPLDAFPAGLETVGKTLPGYHLNELLGWVWLADQPAPWANVGYLLVVGALAGGVALLTFRRREDL